MLNNGNKKFWLFIAILLIGGLVINWFEMRGEAAVVRKPLKEFPAELGQWKQKGDDIKFSQATESVLRASDYVMRDYFSPDGRKVNLYVGYYASQRTGSTYHSPQNCLPGSGWELNRPGSVTVATPSGRVFTANSYIVQNGQYKEVLVYWYQGRGRAVASEYSDKVLTVMDSIFRSRSDGSMVRVMTPVGGGDEETALKAALELSSQTAEKLNIFVPD